MQSDLKEVLKNDLCIGCGACVHADPRLKLELHPEKLFYEPNGEGGEAAASVCPSIRVDFADLQSRLFPGARIAPLGAVEAVMLAQSTHLERNMKASSGGLIKELLRGLLESKEIAGVISIDHAGGLLFKPRLVERLEDVDRLPGSIYHSLPFSDALELLKTREGRFALVAIPCQLEGIFNYIFKFAPELRAKIHTTIGLICGWTYTHHSIKAICDYQRVDFNDIEDISFRGGGPVGRLQMTMKNGRKIEVHRRVNYAYQVAFDRTFNIPRCHLCIDHSNFLADIVVGDAWLPSTVGTKTGISLVICRKPATAALMKSLKEKAAIHCIEVTPSEVEESQTHRVAYGDFSYAYAEYLKDRGIFVPDTIGPNREEARPWSRQAVELFHRETRLKIDLQRKGRYRYLYWRKLTREFGRFSYRYLRWFFVRILRVKSLLGVRKEIPKDRLEGFR